MLLKSLPLLGALFGFLMPGAPVTSAPNLDLPLIFETPDLDCMCMSELTRNIDVKSRVCAQQTRDGVIIVPCFFTEYLTMGAGENGQCPEKTTCTAKPCTFPDIQLMLNWQFEAMHFNEGCYDSDECCPTGVGYAASMLLGPPNDAMNGAGSYKYMPWRRGFSADCGGKVLADWAGLRCDGNDEHTPFAYYEEFWYECHKCPLAGN